MLSEQNDDAESYKSESSPKSEESSDSDPRSHAPSLNPQISDVKQFAPNYDDLHGYLELPAENLVHWSTFNHNITSSEPEIKPVIDSLKGKEFEN